MQEMNCFDAIDNAICVTGTAAVTVAGLLAATKLTNKPLSDNVFLFQGAGEV